MWMSALPAATRFVAGLNPETAFQQRQNLDFDDDDEDD